MAQKREKEETELKVSETIALCSATVSSQQPPSQLPVDDSRTNFARPAGSSNPNLFSSDESSISNSIFTCRLPERSDLISDNDQKKKVGELNRSLKRPRDDANRCSGADCKRKLGLMGFKCRCGDLFCSEHRYSDRHSCSYDYKSAGREAIARENPVVKAAKILKV